MTVKIIFSNGSMVINADNFFTQATLPQVRRMFKMLDESMDGAARKEEIGMWLHEQAARMQDWMAEYAYLRRQAMKLTRDLESRYACMKNPRYPEFTQDKEALKKVRGEISTARRRDAAYKGEYRKAERLWARYRKVLEILEERG